MANKLFLLILFFISACQQNIPTPTPVPPYVSAEDNNEIRKPSTVYKTKPQEETNKNANIQKGLDKVDEKINNLQNLLDEHDKK